MRRAWMAGLVVVATLVAGCGGGDGNDAPGTTDGGSTAGSGEGGGDGTDDTDDADDTALPAFCDLLTADQVTAVVGAAVTLTTGPFDACEFDQEDPRALSGSLGSVEVDTGNGGYDAYRSGSGLTLDDPVEHTLDGIGEDAFLTTGTFNGGENLQAAGGVLVGGVVHTVNLVQGEGLSEEQLVTIGEGLLQLLADAA